MIFFPLPHENAYLYNQLTNDFMPDVLVLMLHLLPAGWLWQ